MSGICGSCLSIISPFCLTGGSVQSGNFRTNLSQGGEINFDDIPSEGVRIAQAICRKMQI